MNISKGKQLRAQRVVIYGTEGIGKTTLASQFPNPLFIDMESGTSQLDVSRTPQPKNWAELCILLDEFTTDTMGFQTLIVDTAGGAERLLIDDLCYRHKWTSLGGVKDFGKSYSVLEREWCAWLSKLDGLCLLGNINVILVAHAHLKRKELPEDDGGYDIWKIRMEGKTGDATKAWADMVLFANYKTIVMKGKGIEKNKAKGGKRTLYTSHHPCRDAKNRHGLPDEIDMDYSKISHIFNVSPAKTPEPDPERLTKGRNYIAANMEKLGEGIYAGLKVQCIIPRDTTIDEMDLPQLEALATLMATSIKENNNE